MNDGIQIKHGRVVGRDGEIQEAEIGFCPECKCETFILMKIKGHQHIQCSRCGTMYCDGTCHVDKTKDLSVN